MVILWDTTIGSMVGDIAEHAVALHYSVAWSQLHCEPPHDKPEWSLEALVVSRQVPLEHRWCPFSVRRPYISVLLHYLLESFLFSKDIFTLETSSCLCSLGLY